MNLNLSKDFIIWFFRRYVSFYFAVFVHLSRSLIDSQSFLERLRLFPLDAILTLFYVFFLQKADSEFRMKIMFVVVVFVVI